MPRNPVVTIKPVRPSPAGGGNVLLECSIDGNEFGIEDRDAKCAWRELRLEAPEVVRLAHLHGLTGPPTKRFRRRLVDSSREVADNG